ncbi:terminase small subunit [Senegalia massiliensis]|uniref:Terminase small subunit n=1 Tax=Senegalia massiliensis TaxID=1720316 RepID=A0A845R1D7_9CLOT|nr:terminase small subunit [Senegalia massiliensis]NBI08230.1 terminase small subunit [Senegalia massiliensis]
MAKKLTIMQKRFCDYYIETANATEAALKAGYSKKTARQMGSENLSKPYIKSYIDERLKILQDKRIAKQEEVLEYLTRAMRGEETEEVVVIESKGDFESKARIIKKQLSGKDRNKAAELLGKRYATFTDNKNLDIKVPEIVFDIKDDENEED